jgi:uncharacterized protein (TIGR00730 family)
LTIIGRLGMVRHMPVAMPSPIHAICVYCGSAKGGNPAFVENAARLGKALAENGIRLVYGGGSVGLMGVLARSVLKHGGQVTGIIPGHLHHVEITQEGLSELIVVPSMHERKRQMFERADAFVSLPGSIGTLDETIEVITWRQLKLHDKPILIVNDQDYWTPFLTLIQHMVAEGFASAATAELFQVVKNIDEILPELAKARLPKLPDREELL